MNKVIKSASAFVAVAAAVAGTILPASNAFAWGDNGGGRASYTLDQINQGVLGNKIVFNSISNSTIGDEKNFVGARVAGTNAGANNVWNGNEINVENGKTYLVRLYVHNNNPKGTKAVAKDVTTSFAIDGNTGTSAAITGYINSSNANPTKYWDSVVFKSANGQPFHLEYVKGSALLENNGVGKNGGVKLSDSIVSGGTKIGYSSLNGQIPGCYQYASYVTIQVKPVFTSDQYLVEKTVRKVNADGSKGAWSESLAINVGDKVEYQIHYKNTSGVSTTNVMVKDILPANLKIVSDVTLFNAKNPSGLKLTTNILSGANIGGYANNGDAYVRFTAQAVDTNLVCGNNLLRNWGQVGVGSVTKQDSADVTVQKTCEPPKPNNYVCKVVDGKYYGKTPDKVVDKATYEKECTEPKPNNYTCKVVDGKYYGKIPDKVVDKATYEKECTKPEPKPTNYTCQIVDGKYYGKTLDKVVDKATYEKECTKPEPKPNNYVCKVVDGKYYGKTADKEVDKATYEKECTTPQELPTTGPTEIAASILGAGSMVTSLGYYIASRKQLR